MAGTPGEVQLLRQITSIYNELSKAQEAAVGQLDTPERRAQIEEGHEDVHFLLGEISARGQVLEKLAIFAMSNSAEPEGFRE